MTIQKTPTIYSLKPQKGYASVSLDTPFFFDHWVSELVLGGVWTGPVEPIPISIDYPRRSGFKIGDLISGMHLKLLCTEKAIDLLDLHRSDQWQFFPTKICRVDAEFGASSETDSDTLEKLQNSDQRWYLVHPTSTFDALDTLQTVCAGAVMGTLASILKCEFQDNLTPPSLFVPKHLVELTATKEFYDLLKTHDLHGVKGQCLWDQRRGGRWQQPEHVLDLHFRERTTLAKALEQSEKQRRDMEASLEKGLDGAPEYTKDLLATAVNAADQSNQTVTSWERDREALPLAELPSYRTATKPLLKLTIPQPGFKLPACSRVQFSGDGRFLWVEHGRTVTRWSVADRAAGPSVRMPLPNTEFVASSDDKTLIVKDTNGNLALIDTETGDLIWRFKPPHYEGDGCSPSCSSDGTIICDGTSDGTLRFHQSSDGALLHEECLGIGYMIRYVTITDRAEIVAIVERKSAHASSTKLPSHIFIWAWPPGRSVIRSIVHDWHDDLHGAVEPGGFHALVSSTILPRQYDRNRGEYQRLQRVCLMTGNVTAEADYWMDSSLQPPSFSLNGNLSAVDLERGSKGIFFSDTLD